MKKYLTIFVFLQFWCNNCQISLKFHLDRNFTCVFSYLCSMDQRYHIEPYMIVETHHLLFRAYNFLWCRAKLRSNDLFQFITKIAMIKRRTNNPCLQFGCISKSISIILGYPQSQLFSEAQKSTHFPVQLQSDKVKNYMA